MPLHELTITIELSRQEIVTLGNWASVGRSFDRAETLLSNCSCQDDQDLLYANKEIKDLHRPLESVAMKIRTEIWKLRQFAIDTIFMKYKRKDIDFEQAVKEFVDQGVWEFKAREWLRELPPERKDFS